MLNRNFYSQGSDVLMHQSRYLEGQSLYIAYFMCIMFSNHHLSLHFFVIIVFVSGSPIDFRLPREGRLDQVVGLPSGRVQGSHQAGHCQLHPPWSRKEPQAALLCQPSCWYVIHWKSILCYVLLKATNVHVIRYNIRISVPSDDCKIKFGGWRYGLSIDRQSCGNASIQFRVFYEVMISWRDI